MAHKFGCWMEYVITEAGLSEEVCATWYREAQQDAEAAAAEESQRLRRLAAQEALLKDTFLEAVEAEKERLLLAREKGRERGVQRKSVPQARLIHHCVMLWVCSSGPYQVMPSHLFRKSVPILFSIADMSILFR